MSIFFNRKWKGFEKSVLNYYKLKNLKTKSYKKPFNKNVF